MQKLIGRMQILIAFLMLPAALLAGGLKANRPIAKPDKEGMTEVRSQRTERSKTWDTGQVDSLGKPIWVTMIGPRELHYLDPVAGYVEIDYEGQDSAGWKVVDIGNKRRALYRADGTMRYERNKKYFQTRPSNFDTSMVTIENILSGHGIKQNVIVDRGGPTTLKWTTAFTGDKKANGKRFKVNEQSVVQIYDYRAWDAVGKTIPLTVEYFDSIISVSFDTAGITFPATIDPAYGDTVHSDSSKSVGFFDTARSSSTGTVNNGRLYVHGEYSSNVGRSYMAFDVSGLSVPSRVDSVFIRLVTVTMTAVSDTIFLVQSTMSGNATTSSFSAFTGWASTGALSPVIYSDSIYSALTTPGDTVYFRLNSAAMTELADSMGVGKFGTAMLSAWDVRDTEMPSFGYWGFFGPDIPNIYIYYAPGNPPGLTTADTDTLRYVQHEFYATIDSTGGTNLTVRGFQSILNLLWSDTSTVSDTGNYTAGAFSHLSPLLLPDTSYLVRAFGINLAGTSYSAWDTISTAVSGGGSIRVDGRLVNRAR